MSLFDPAAAERARISASVAAWREAKRPKPPEPLPVPETPWRAAEAHEVPRSAAAAHKNAQAAGWDARVRYCRGPYIGADGQMLSMADGIALVVLDGTGHLAAWATWYRRDGDDPKYKFESAIVNGRRATSPELKAYLKEGPA